MTLRAETPAAIEPSPPAKLLVEGVSKWFRTPRATVHALDNINLRVAEGEFICLVGPSGCGKSTLLDVIAGLTMPDEGRVLADDQVVAGPGRHRLVMFQESALFPWLNVFGNVMFGLKRVPGLTRKQRHEIAAYYLKLVGLEKFGKAYVHELSGGMKQRVALARSLAPDPRVLLMDEPLAALDALTRRTMQREVLRIWEQTQKTIVFVTHDIDEAVIMADRIFVMAQRPSFVLEVEEVGLSRPRGRDDPEFARLTRRLSALLE